jgi:diguanylate cyclase (GGDEF)-like protein
MVPNLRKLFRDIGATTGAVLGIAKTIDYKTLNHYIISMNESHSLDGILMEASKCLKEILNYQLFAFAVQDHKQLDVWIDPRIYQAPLRKVIEQDFRVETNSPVQTHFLNELEASSPKQVSFQDSELLSHVIMNGHCLARLYVLPKRRMFPYHNEILETIVKTLGVSLNNYLNIKRLESDVAFDPLTGCYNRREFDRLIEHHIANAHRHKKPLSLIMFDIDHFKRVNDTYGHPAGDAALKQITAAVQNVIRKDDYLARYGGEEFVVVLPDTKMRKAIGLAQRLRRNIEKLEIELPGGKSIHKTASFGVTALKQHSNREKLVKEADVMLYKAKAMGRNMVMPNLDLRCVREDKGHGFMEDCVPSFTGA